MRRFTHVLSWAIFGYLLAVEVLLLVGFVLVLVGVEPSTWLADWLYTAVERTMAPFRGAFTAVELADPETAAQVEPAIETSILFAMIVYGILALAAHDLVEWLGGRTSVPTPISPQSPEAQDDGRSVPR